VVKTGGKALNSQRSGKSVGDDMRTSTAAHPRQSGPISVEIRGQRLTIRSDKESAFVEGLAKYIDTKVAELQSAAPTASFDKLLMLASLTVAEELFETRGQIDDMRRQLKERSAAMVSLLEECERIQ
jgi:cell division protein ZapA (FtsZ GTPase activity inhibitor)